MDGKQKDHDDFKAWSDKKNCEERRDFSGTNCKAVFSGNNKHNSYRKGGQCLEEAGQGNLAVLVRCTISNAGMKRMSMKS